MNCTEKRPESSPDTDPYPDSDESTPDFHTYCLKMALPSGFSTKMLYAFLISSMHDADLLILFLLDFTAVIKHGID